MINKRKIGIPILSSAGESFLDKYKISFRLRSKLINHKFYNEFTKIFISR